MVSFYAGFNNVRMQIILNISEIDCLMGVALCRKSMSGPVCRPEFVDGESLLELEGIRLQVD